MEVADRIVVMNEGRIEQIGSPAEIYDHPASPFVMSFVAAVNVLPQEGHAAVSFWCRRRDEPRLSGPGSGSDVHSPP